jgi:hypothetical protein
MIAKTKKRKGRPKGRFVNTVKKEPTKVLRIRISKIEAVKKINSEP